MSGKEIHPYLKQLKKMLVDKTKTVEEIAIETKISVGHVHHIIHKPELYPLSQKMISRIEESEICEAAID